MSLDIMKYWGTQTMLKDFYNNFLFYYSAFLNYDEVDFFLADTQAASGISH